MHRLKPRTGGEPIERIRIQGSLTERALPGGRAVPPGVPERAQAAHFGAGRPVLPAAGNKPTGGYYQQPGQGMDHGHGPPEGVRSRLVVPLVAEIERKHGAGVQQLGNWPVAGEKVSERSHARGWDCGEEQQ